MNTTPIPPSNDEWDPSTAALLRGIDPWDPARGEALLRSRGHTASIPNGGYVPVISQRSSPAFETTKIGTVMEQKNGMHRRLAARRWGAALALAASGAVIAGVAVVSQGGNFPHPAAPSLAPSPSNNYFNPDDSAQFDTFGRNGGTRLTGWLRPATPQDPKDLQATGWLLNIFVMAGGTEDKNRALIEADEPWIPIDLAGVEVSKLGDISPNGQLVVIAAQNPTPSLVTPVPGPYGLMVSDPRKLAAGPLVEARSLKTLDGSYLQKPDINYNGAMLAQFATFQMAYVYATAPSKAPEDFAVTGFFSHTSPEARSCIVATTAAGDKVLAFPEGATASTTMDESNGPDGSVAGSPLRVMTGNAWFEEGEDSTFILETAGTPPATIKGWRTGKTGSCGSFNAEIVNFSSAGK